MLQDFALISVLLVVGQLLRSRVGILQSLMIPAAVLAGLLGLAGGRQGPGWLPFLEQPDGRLAIASIPSELVAILFGTLFLGHRSRHVAPWQMFRRVGDTFFYNLTAEIGQYGFALLFGLIVLAPLFPELPTGFPLMLPSGFAGGHGTATVVSESLQKIGGWDEARTIGYTFATIGLICGILFGLLLINIGVRRGWTAVVSSTDTVSLVQRRGFLERNEQRSLGRATVNSISLEPLAWHLSLALCTYAGARGINSALQAAFPDAQLLPLFAVAMAVGAVLQRLLDALGVGEYVDREVMARVGSATSDYLIAFAIASIDLQIVADNLLPLAIMSVFGLAFTTAMLCWLGPRMFRNFWFERSLFVFGWSVGVVATGVLLLRIVDPTNRSRTLDDYAVAYVVISLLEILLLVVLPPLVARGIVVGPTLVLIAGAVTCMVLSRRWVGWLPADRRRHETEPPIVE